MEDQRYQPDATFARKFASEAAIAPSAPPPEVVLPVASPEPRKAFLTFEPVGEKQERAAKLIEQGVEALLADPDSFYKFSGRFHRYSIPNQILIMAQRPDATRCASVATWNSMGRRINQGEHGLSIFYPIFGKEMEKVDPDTGVIARHKPLIGFGVGNTFDISQTNGKPIPEEPTVVDRLGESEAAKDIDRRGASYGLGEGLRFTKIPIGQARGFYAPGVKTIGLNEDAPFGEILTTKTLLHERAHFEDPHILTGKRSAGEQIAESAAFMTMNHFGHDTSAYSHHYLASWATDMHRLRHNLGDAQKIATKLITKIEAENPERMTEWL